ncbi:hypothetical protein BU24DRAFT_492630 [Aaosphaeria arxii CBS 175.79]|uniref:Uncharacterized protein n=1 Tax=Aaosphaeria arxii CBS 175.79 TaxID=1450172 RepID=A0A6A5XWF1_9PLEO|nr:uncharacterized protein BU24DRAFT_492630 [Aaosphaeria arxii CBS 175.79]KAF2016564.1 hypothetical protein BU24DRAFT_492630 [Aaosphaeria arxii CBS 175.79]
MAGAPKTKPSTHRTGEVRENKHNVDSFTTDGLDTIVDESKTLLENEADLRALRARFELAIAEKVACGNTKDGVSLKLTREGGQQRALLLIKGESRFEERRYEKILADLQVALRGIASAVTGKGTDAAKEKLKVITFECFRERLNAILPQLDKRFDEAMDELNALSARGAGVDVDLLLKHEADLITSLLELERGVSSIVKGHIQKPHLADIVQEAFTIVTDGALQLRYLFQDDEVFDRLLTHIVLLAKPKLIFNTCVRAARSLDGFSSLRIRHQKTAMPQGLSPLGQSSRTNPGAPSTYGSTIPDHNRVFWTLNSPRQSQRETLVYEELPVGLIQNMRSLVKPFLEEKDRHAGIFRIFPVAKQNAVKLLGYILQGLNPPPEEEGHYDAGFVLCQTSQQEKSLGDMYQHLFKRCGERTGKGRELFTMFWVSIHNNDLFTILDRCGYSYVQTIIPGLKQFLNTHKEQRPSVYRLVQFLRTDSLKPSELLCQDYGFRNCKAMHHYIETMKETYTDVLKFAAPPDLHKAAQMHRLLDFIRENGVNVEEGNERLFKTFG